MKDIVLNKYSGAGNDFIVLDGRYDDVSDYRNAATISSLCDRHGRFVTTDGRTGADGLMILSSSEAGDFRMEFFNPDGSTGMMCGNGGRCIVAFAESLGIRPANGSEYVFEAPDGIHRATVESKDGDRYIVRLKMRQPSEPVRYEQGWFIDTGTRHLVRFVDDLNTLDVPTEGARLRHLPVFAPEGVNVDFVSRPSATLAIRTFEKGVEAETLACGTGIVAAAVVHCHVNRLIPPQTVSVEARQDTLIVDILSDGVWLTGPARFIESRS